MALLHSCILAAWIIGTTIRLHTDKPYRFVEDEQLSTPLQFFVYCWRTVAVQKRQLASLYAGMHAVRLRVACCRLALSLVRQPWFEPPVEPLAAVMRRQLDSFPFRQLPRYLEEGNVDLVQSMVSLKVASAGTCQPVPVSRYLSNKSRPGWMLLYPRSDLQDMW